MISGFLSLEEFNVDLLRGTHRLRAVMLGESSELVTYTWTRLG